ncbi:DUF1877 family protein [Streptomyces sp. NPDC059837]|uniref:DUF1877 family protein n=1 Tax=Streptomyces sp. NPDC059837 TaxID=3346968 RepID=UPI003655AF69
MDMTLRRMPSADAERGFGWVVSRFSGAGDDAKVECSPGRDWETLEGILLAEGPAEVSELPITTGDLLGDDDLGTACFYLPPDEVPIAVRFLSSVDFERAVADQANAIADTFRNRDVPQGYLEVLVSRLEEIRDLYAAAEQAGEGVAKLVRG